MFAILLLAALVACGGTPATVANQVATNPTPTTAVGVPLPSSTTLPGSPTVVPSRATTPAPASPTRVANLPAAPTPTTPRASGSSPPVAPTAIPQPNGPIPAGWQVYRGTVEFPFVLAYPPDWIVDDSLLPEQRIIFLYGPGGRDDAERIDLEISQTQSGANIDVQRDEFFREESAFCDAKGIEYTEHRQVAGATFAILGATCDASNELSFMQVASGLIGGDEWNILMRTHYDRKEARLREVFNPVLASLNIYARVP